MFASCGSLEDAKAAFEKIKQRNVFSWNIMLAAYAQKGHLREAREVFEAMEKRDVVSWTTLLSGYAKIGFVEEARAVFDGIKQRSDVSWSSMIAAYAQNEHFVEALNLFRVMSLEGVKARPSSWVSVIDSCGNTLARESGESLHDAVKESGLESEVVVGTALVDMLGKFGHLEKAREVFDRISEKNTVSWNAMMSAYARVDRFEQALDLFYTMCLIGIRQDCVTFITFFGICSRAPAFASDGECWIDRLADAGFDLDCSLQTAVVKMLVSYGRFDRAKFVFDSMRQRSAVTWTIILRACGDPKTAIRMLALMDLDGIFPDKVVILSVLETCSSIDTPDRVRRLHRDLLEGTSFDSDPKVGTGLIILYSRSGSLADARSCFDRIVGGTVASWTAMIVAYIQNGHCYNALQLFRRMDLEGIHPDAITFGYVLSVCANAGARHQGRSIHSAILEAGIFPEGELAIALVEMYSSCGSKTESAKIFDGMKLELPLHRIVAGLHCQEIDEQEVEKIFRDLDLEGSILDRETVVAIVGACSQSSIARMIHSRGLESGWIRRDDSNLAAALIDMHGKSGNLIESRVVFDELRGFRDGVV